MEYGLLIKILVFLVLVAIIMFVLGSMLSMSFFLVLAKITIVLAAFDLIIILFKKFFA